MDDSAQKSTFEMTTQANGPDITSPHHSEDDEKQSNKLELESVSYSDHSIGSKE